MRKSIRPLFERLSATTYDLLGRAKKACIHLTETTFTELNLLGMATAKLPNLHIGQAKGRDEPKKGYDWEWWIGWSGRWWRCSVQAKVLHAEENCYRHIWHRVSRKKWQIDILEDFANAKNSIPLYCFYNGVSAEVGRRGWHCSKRFDVRQLGCTVVPLGVIKRLRNVKGKPGFEEVHEDPLAIPWRCLLTCLATSMDRHPLAPGAQPYAELPPEVEQMAHLRGNRIHEVELSPDWYGSDRHAHPRAIAVIDLGMGKSAAKKRCDLELMRSTAAHLGGEAREIKHVLNSGLDAGQQCQALANYSKQLMDRLWGSREIDPERESRQHQTEDPLW